MGLLGEDMADVIDLKSKLRKHTEIKKEPTKRKIVRINNKDQLFIKTGSWHRTDNLAEESKIWGHPYLYKLLGLILHLTSWKSQIKVTQRRSQVIEPGTFFFSVSKYAEILKITPKQVKLGLKILAKSGLITSQVINRKTLVTVCNAKEIYNLKKPENSLRAQVMAEVMVDKGSSDDKINHCNHDEILINPDLKGPSDSPYGLKWGPKWSEITNDSKELRPPYAYTQEYTNTHTSDVTTSTSGVLSPKQQEPEQPKAAARRKTIKDFPEFNEIFKEYPERDGSQGNLKTLVDKVTKIIRSGRREELKRAIANYNEYCVGKETNETQFVMMFSTFLTSKTKGWEAWIDIHDSQPEGNNTGMIVYRGGGA